MRYFGILDGSGDVWGVRIPDFPGCFGGGGSASAAIADAISAMRLMAQLIAEEGRSLPESRSVEQLRSDEDVAFDPAAGEAFVVLPLLLDSGRPARANISLDRNLLDAIDKAAKARGLTRSAFLASAAREKILAES